MIDDTVNTQYYIERLNADNLTGLEVLHAAVYGRLPPPGFFLKKYDTSFTGIMYTGFIAYNNQHQAVAFYGVIPCFIKAGEEIILAAQSADTMTHPEHRNKGLFIELATTTFQLCHKSNIKLLFGFPNQNSLPGFINKLGWEITDAMDCFIIHTDDILWKRILGKIPVLNALYTNYKKSILKKYQIKQAGLANSVFENGYAGIYRDDAYFKYKTYNDIKVIKTGRSTLWIKADTVLLIGDISVLPDDFDDMIYELKKLAKKLGIKQIHFHASPGTTLHGLFAMRFNSTPSFPVIFKVLEGGLSIDKIKFTSADIDTF